MNFEILKPTLISLCLLLACSSSQRQDTVGTTGSDARGPEDGDSSATAETTSGSDSTPAGPPRPGLCGPTQREPGQLPRSEPAADRAGILHVGYSSRSEEGSHSAGRFVRPDGLVSGHHRSGAAEAPMMSVEHGLVSQACVIALWTVAARVMQAAEGQPPPSRGPGTASITFHTTDDRDVSVSWPVRTEPSDPDVRILWQMLGEMEIGYW